MDLPQGSKIHTIGVSESFFEREYTSPELGVSILDPARALVNCHYNFEVSLRRMRVQLQSVIPLVLEKNTIFKLSLWLYYNRERIPK